MMNCSPNKQLIKNDGGGGGWEGTLYTNPLPNILHKTSFTSLSTTGELNWATKRGTITLLGSVCPSNCWNRRGKDRLYNPFDWLPWKRKQRKVYLVSSSLDEEIFLQKQFMRFPKFLADWVHIQHRSLYTQFVSATNLLRVRERRKTVKDFSKTCCFFPYKNLILNKHNICSSNLAHWKLFYMCPPWYHGRYDFSLTAH